MVHPVLYGLHSAVSKDKHINKPLSSKQQKEVCVAREEGGAYGRYGGEGGLSG